MRESNGALKTEVDRLQAANTILEKQLHVKTTELSTKDLHIAARVAPREEKLLSQLRQAEMQCAVANDEASASRRELVVTRQYLQEIEGERDCLKKKCDQLSTHAAQPGDAVLGHTEQLAAAKLRLEVTLAESDALKSTCQKLEKENKELETLLADMERETERTQKETIALA